MGARAAKLDSDSFRFSSDSDYYHYYCYFCTCVNLRAGRGQPRARIWPIAVLGPTPAYPPARSELSTRLVVLVARSLRSILFSSTQIYPRKKGEIQARLPLLFCFCVPQRSPSPSSSSPIPYQPFRPCRPFQPAFEPLANSKNLLDRRSPTTIPHSASFPALLSTMNTRTRTQPLPNRTSQSQVLRKPPLPRVPTQPALCRRRPGVLSFPILLHPLPPRPPTYCKSPPLRRSRSSSPPPTSRDPLRLQLRRLRCPYRPRSVLLHHLSLHQAQRPTSPPPFRLSTIIIIIIISSRPCSAPSSSLQQARRPSQPSPLLRHPMDPCQAQANAFPLWAWASWRSVGCAPSGSQFASSGT